MRYCLFFISFFVVMVSFSQVKKTAGTYNNTMWGINLKLKIDSTFEYSTKGQHPTFNTGEDFSEKGRWTILGDTIILNPQLSKKPFAAYDLLESENQGDTSLLLTFNHIKRYFDVNGNINRIDTLQIERLDYSFNQKKKKNFKRVALYPTTRCAFAGYIPDEIITTNRTISIKRPTEGLRSIIIGCHLLVGTKEFVIHNPYASRLTFNVYSNYYQEGQIRQMKLLIGNSNTLYTQQKRNGDFVKDNLWTGTSFKLKRGRAGS